MRMDDPCCEYVVQKLFYAWHSHPMSANILTTGPGGYKTFFMLNSTEHEISTAHKS